MTNKNTDNTDEPTKAELHERVRELESTVAKMMPSRRDALKLGAAGIAGAAGLGAASQTADASTGSAGTIGSTSDRPDAFLDEANVNQLTGVSTGGIYEEDPNSPFQANGSDIDAQLSQSYDHVIGLISSTLTGRVGTNNCGLSVNGGNNIHDYVEHSGTSQSGSDINIGRLQSVAGRFTLTRGQRGSLAFSSQLGMQTNINFHAEYGKVEEPDISSIQLFDRSNNSNDIGLQLRVFFA